MKFMVMNGLTTMIRAGMKIGKTKQSNCMRKTIQKFLNTSIRKLRQHKEQLKKNLRFSSYKEDFVITEQEEREGGFYGLRVSSVK